MVGGEGVNMGYRGVNIRLAHQADAASSQQARRLQQMVQRKLERRREQLT